MAKSLFLKNSPKNSKFRSLSKSRHLPFVLKSFETRIKTMKIFSMGKLKKKEADIYCSPNFFSLKEYFRIWKEFLEN